MLYIGYNFKHGNFVTTPNYDVALDDEGAVYVARDTDVDYLKGRISILTDEKRKIRKCEKCGRPFYRHTTKPVVRCADCAT